MALWDWTLRAYGQPGVPDTCLTLQDAHGQNTPLLLWAVWAEADDPALLARAADLAHRWDALAVGPLRDLRRALKPAFAGVEDREREGLREDVKAAELRAERVLMEALEALGGEPGGAPALAALEAASKAWGRPAPADALAALAAALG
ncbi:TIGR02444 family protein [Phenylobacterium sp.]|uniref:TIGR02444 family protein n=1 Tax=Phenylobacterium sp. TaxID=1871053 RepID=UPI0011F5E969|nr:TIGR02444 family protein [Phenylobacterium sp.]THD62401.1 MAG: TIGR02444 family protein [Phenylobacterium sp.]